MSPSRISLRRRLVILVGGGLLALLVAQYVATALVLDERQEDMIDAVLNEQMRYSLELYHKTGEAPELNVPHLTFYAWPNTAAPASIPLVFQKASIGNHEAFLGKTEYHFVVHEENGMRFLLAYNVEQIENEFAALLIILGIAFLLSASLAFAGIYWLSGKALNNLTQLSRAVRENKEKALAQPFMESEVYLLATALDDYRAKQALLLSREQEFSGYLSHELRTPLSVMRGQAEMLSLSVETAQKNRALSIMAQADHMRALIEQLLHLARRTHHPQRTEIALLTLIERLWSALSLEQRSRTQLQCSIPSDYTLSADPLLVELILRNALANARLHADGAVLSVSLQQQTLIIEDYRSQLPDNENIPVSDENDGLGLTILKRACAAMSWSCEITSLPTGFRIALTFDNPSKNF